MPIKIEKTPLMSRHKNGEFREFVLALKALKVGESFSLPQIRMSNYRMAISITQMLMNVQLVTRTEGKNTRVARTA